MNSFFSEHHNRYIFLAFKPRLLFLRIAMIICFLMMILCAVLIAYDILVLVDPTRCFFLNCNGAVVNASNSTTNITVTGWPLSITWPSYFQTNMNAKRIFQSIQILCACLFILFSALYILTYFIYRKINLHQTSIYNADHRTIVSHETVRSPTKHSNHIVESYPDYNKHGHMVTMYMIDGPVISGTKYHSSSASHATAQEVVPKKIRGTTARRPQTTVVNYDRICTRCMQEPRMILTTNNERQNYFSHLCASCNNEILNYQRKPTATSASSNQTWKP